MTKQELSDGLAARQGLSKTKAEAVLNDVLEAVKKALQAGEIVRFKGFGSFTVKARAARKGRDPRTQEVIDIPPGLKVAFRPAQDLV